MAASPSSAASSPPRGGLSSVTLSVSTAGGPKANLGVNGLLPDDDARAFGCRVAVSSLSREGPLALALAAAPFSVAAPFGLAAVAGQDVRDLPRGDVVGLIRGACERGGAFDITLIAAEGAATALSPLGSPPLDSPRSASASSPPPLFDAADTPTLLPPPPPPPPVLQMAPPPQLPPPPPFLPPPPFPPSAPMAPAPAAALAPAARDETSSSSSEEDAEQLAERRARAAAGLPAIARSARASPARVARRAAMLGASPSRASTAGGMGAALPFSTPGPASGGAESSASERAARARRCVGFLLKCGGLKSEKRTGWVHAGVALPESVADHSHRAALIALLAARHAEGAPDARHAALVALVHDLAESVTGDIVPEERQRERARAGAAAVSGASAASAAGAGAASRVVGKQEKAALEAAAMESLRAELAPHSEADSFGALWREYEAHATPAARLVKDADKLEMLLQALEYERAQPGLDLSPFYEARARIAGAEAAAMADEVLRLRQVLLSERAGAPSHRLAPPAIPAQTLAPATMSAPAGFSAGAVATAAAACFAVGALVGALATRRA